MNLTTTQSLIILTVEDSIRQWLERNQRNVIKVDDIFKVSCFVSEAIYNDVALGIKKQIIDAHIAGQKFASDNDNPDSEEYFNQTYPKP